jgi:adenosylcobinamide amidohydrolase
VRLVVHWRVEDGIRLPMACWHPGPGYRMISSGVLGGGIGPREWALNAQVPSRYARTDPAGHLTELAARLGLTGPGIGMLTAARVTNLITRSDEGAEAAVTTGLRVPTWAAAPADAADAHLAPGTINIIVSVPVPLTDAALVNAVITATEAKTQAVLDAGIPGTGTATDAVCVAALAPPGAAAEDFAGPRSAWGARIARAVHAAVLAGATGYRASRLPAVVHWRDDVPPAAGTHDDGHGVDPGDPFLGQHPHRRAGGLDPHLVQRHQLVGAVSRRGPCRRVAPYRDAGAARRRHRAGWSCPRRWVYSFSSRIRYSELLPSWLI